MNSPNFKDHPQYRFMVEAILTAKVQWENQQPFMAQRAFAETYADNIGGKLEWHSIHPAFHYQGREYLFAEIMPEPLEGFRVGDRVKATQKERERCVKPLADWLEDKTGTIIWLKIDPNSGPMASVFFPGEPCQTYKHDLGCNTWGLKIGGLIHER